MLNFVVDSFESRMNPRFLARSDWEGNAVRAKSNRVREGNCGEGFEEEEKS